VGPPAAPGRLCRVRMFEYGVLHLSFRPEFQPHGYVFEWHFGLDRELDGVPFHVDRDLPVPPGQGPLRRLAHPGLAAVYLGRRGWEPFQVEWVQGFPGPAVEYHFRRSSEDKPTS
jgi:hypothetical protein